VSKPFLELNQACQEHYLLLKFRIILSINSEISRLAEISVIR
jgi:hypothetical protein